jgi:hypothetical protein
MHRKSFALCGLAVVAGIFGAFCRWLQNTTAFEPDTGLAIPNSLWSQIMAVYIAAAFVLFVVLVRWLKDNKKITAELSFPDAFRGGKLICTVAAAASAALMAAGGLMGLAAQIGGGFTLGLFESAAAVFASLCVFTLLRRVNSDSPRNGSGPLVSIVLYLCLRLVNEYKVSASDPVLWNFAIRILAICAVTLAYYYFAGYCYGRAKPHRALYVSFLGIFLSIISLADGVSLSFHLVTAGLVLAQLVLTLLLIGNMTNPAHGRQ